MQEILLDESAYHYWLRARQHADIMGSLAKVSGCMAGHLHVYTHVPLIPEHRHIMCISIKHTAGHTLDKMLVPCNPIERAGK